MPEFIRSAEVIGVVAEKAYNVGKFVLGHLKGGAWGDTANEITPANITFVTGEEDE